MRLLPIVAVLLLAGCLNLGPPGPTTQAPVTTSDAEDASSTTGAMPGATLGDSFHWRGRFTFDATQAPSPGERGWNARIAAFENVTISSGTFAAARREGTVTSLDSTGTTMNVTSWARSSDFALLKQTVVEPQASGPATTTDTTWRVPCVEYEWPFAVGDTWSSACIADIVVRSGAEVVHSGVFRMITTYKVEAKVQLTVGDEALDAFRLNETVRGDVGGSNEFQRVEYVAPKACGASADVTTSGQDRGAYRLVAYSCAATA